MIYLFLRRFHSKDWLLAQRALKFNLEPVIDALTVEFMSAIKGFNHLASFEDVNADRTIWSVGFFTCDRAATGRRFFISKSSIRIYNVSDLFRRKFLLFFILLRLKLRKMRRRIVWVKSTLFWAVLIISIVILIVIRILEMLMVLLKLRLTWHSMSVESVAIEIHLNVLWIHTLNIAHHARYVREKVWEVRELAVASHREVCTWLLTSTSLMKSLIVTELELEILMLLLSITSLPRKLTGVCMVMLLLPKSLLSLAY